MKRLSAFPGLALSCLLAPIAAGRAADPPWRGSFEAALAEAKEKNLPLFVAIGHDSERVCREMATTHYRDDGFQAVMQSFVCLVASASHHKTVKVGDKKVCSLYGTISCEEHIAIESQVRRTFLSSDLVTVPQHLVLSPAGKLLEAREYFLSVPVLKRFLMHQLAQVRPDLALGKDVAAEVSQGKIGERLREALKSEDREQRAAALRVLADFDPDEIMREMEATFASLNSEQKGAMLLALATPGTSIAVPILGRHLSGSDPHLRACAAQALGKLGDTQAIIPLRRRVTTEPDAVARGSVVEALASFAAADEGALKAVVQAASDREAQVRARAYIALGRVESAAAEPPLLKGLDSKERALAGAAVWGCGKKKVKAAQPRIEKLLKSFPDVRFKVVAEAALKRIRGEAVDDAFYEEQKDQFLDGADAGG